MNTRPVIFGEVLFDCFADGHRVLGGAPFNVAWHLQAFGCAPLLVSRLGSDDDGQVIRKAMTDWGMSEKGLQTDSVHSTGQVVVSVHNGEPEYDIVDPSAWDFIAETELTGLNKLDGLNEQSVELIYHGSLALRHETSRQALNVLTQQQQAPIFMDVNLRDPWWQQAHLLSLMDQATWVKINEHELQLLVEGNDDHSRARQLMTRHKLSLVIVTQGSRGAFALTADGESASVSPETVTNVVDTVGAGDAFASVCMLAIMRQWDIADMLDRAQQFASVMVARQGATVNDSQLYKSMLEDWHCDQLSMQF
ncbi:MAG: carbohydrate kinase [Gammaproteobacteria bacterium]